MNTYFLIVAHSTEKEIVWGPYLDFNTAAMLLVDTLPTFFEDPETVYTAKVIEVFLEDGMWKTLREKTEIYFEPTHVS